jgi:hypothetical protein
LISFRLRATANNLHTSAYFKSKTKCKIYQGKNKKSSQRCRRPPLLEAGRLDAISGRASFS